MIPEKLEFTATKEQSEKLRGLAYWTAERAWINERIGPDSDDADRARKTVYMIGEQLARLGVPNWVGCAVVFWADQWRRYEGAGLASELAKSNIYIK